MSQTQTTWPLKKPQQLIYVELGPCNGGMVLGICEEGFSFRSVAPLRSEGPINFAFALDGANRLQGTGEIAWTEEDGKTGGMKFSSVSPQFRDSLRYWLEDEAEQKNIGREVTPAVAIPLDSMEKIKEVVRTGNVEEVEAAPPPKPIAARPKEVKLAETKFVQQRPAEAEPINAKPVEAKAAQEKTVEVTPPEARRIETKPIETNVEAKTAESKPAEKTAAEFIAPRPQPQRTTKPTAQSSSQAQPLLGEAKPLPRMRLYFAPQVPQPPLQPSPQPITEVSAPEVKPLDPELGLPAPETIPPEPKATTSASAPETIPAEAEAAVPIPAPENIPAEKESEIPPAAAQESAPPEERLAPERPVSALEAAPHESPVEPLHPLWLNERERATEISDRSSSQELPQQEAWNEGAVAEPARLDRSVAAGIIGLALAVILGALVLSFRREAGHTLIRLGEALAGEEQKSAIPAPQTTSGSNASVPTSHIPASQADNSLAEKNQEANASAAQDKTAAAQTENANPQQNLSTPTDKTATADSNHSTAAASENGTKEIQNTAPEENGTGQKEFEQARDLLKGNHRQHDLPQAVKLLWTAVRKGYVPAEVTLADLFARGDGVGRNCQQARILLQSAVKKGSPEGRRRLDQLNRQGCS